MRPWQEIIPAEDREVYDRAGYGQAGGFGDSPAVLIVDMNYNFVGDRDEPILDSIARFRQSCGSYGWAAVRAVADLLTVARAKGVPVMYTTVERRPDRLDDTWGGKQNRADREGTDFVGAKGTQIVAEIAPCPEDLLIPKKSASFFFGTPLVTYLVQRRIDTLIVCGGTTSGCVRATAIDGHAYGFKVVVPEECVFDRGQLSHAVNLFDINQKYGDVRPLSEVKQYLEGPPR